MDAITRAITTKPASRRGFVTVPSTAVSYPGVYVSQRGLLFRVFDEALTDADDSDPRWEALDGLLVTRVSDDPRTPIADCRRLAEEAGLPVRF